MGQRRQGVIVGYCLAALLSLLLLFVFLPSHPHEPSYHDHASATGVEKNAVSDAASADPSDISYHPLVSPIPVQERLNKAQALLGWVLFNDANLSSNNSVSCESCHHLDGNGAERSAVSVGVHGQGIRNSLTVYNTAYNYRFFWDGRVNSLHDQIDGPIHSDVEMDSNWNNIEAYLTASNSYAALFEAANLTVSEQSVKTALVEFMRGLNTPNAPFDRYLKGDASALTAQQVRGWETFQQEGCIRCHRGTNIGGGMVMRFGFFGENTRGAERSTDTGRHLETEKPEDMYLFRVASLRNVAETAPYFHDGRTQTLEQAIQIMGESQLGKTFDPNTIADLSAFLTSLSGDRPAILEEFENE
uniref:cytochrome-c peroxidase n=1 Tax=Thaumasiovibrio occultus TaxID=1891184 RepID=UPI000B35272A|nr:cytochrome c peroxidase [Thaumasiovibrio occultus]